MRHAVHTVLPPKYGIFNAVAHCTTDHPRASEGAWVQVRLRSACDGGGLRSLVPRGRARHDHGRPRQAQVPHDPLPHHSDDDHHHLHRGELAAGTNYELTRQSDFISLSPSVSGGHRGDRLLLPAVGGDGLREPGRAAGDRIPLLLLLVRRSQGVPGAGRQPGVHVRSRPGQAHLQPDGDAPPPQVSPVRAPAFQLGVGASGLLQHC